MEHFDSQFDLWDLAQARGITRRHFLALLAAGGSAAILSACFPHAATPTPTPQPTQTPLPIRTPSPIPSPTPKSLGVPPPATYAQLPRWRGFNLIEKSPTASYVTDSPYKEWDLDFMAEWGFNFIRLPLDYLIWTISPGVYRDQPLKEIDQCIGWARARGIHVNLNLHRVPGYWVSGDGAQDLWALSAAGDEARKQFAAQWQMLAARYRGIPPSELSFNLLNEPPTITPAQYLKALVPAIEAIRKIDPVRLIIADGLDYALKPVKELVPYQVAQSAHQYLPMQLTHYDLPWVEDATLWPVPTWPIPVVVNKYLYGRVAHPSFHSPLILLGSFLKGSRVSILVRQVSTFADLRIRADGQTILKKEFKPAPGQADWKKLSYQPEWFNYLGEYDTVYTTYLPSNAREIRFEILNGDYLTFSEIRIKPIPSDLGNEVVIRPGDSEWGKRQMTILVDDQGGLTAGDRKIRFDKAGISSNLVKPWKTFSDRYGIGIHVGELGVANQTPHPVALSWLRDSLDLWKEAGVGWALWNLHGVFGVLDSQRIDVKYEDYRGAQLDRKMLEILLQG